MKRGDAWWVNFDSSIGGEITKRRPAVIVSIDASNKSLNRVQVVPLTGNTEKLYPSEAYINVNRKLHKAMADQIATVSKKRLSRKMGTLNEEDMQEIERAIRTQLGLH